MLDVYVCQQLVCINECGPAGTFHISKGPNQDFQLLNIKYRVEMSSCAGQFLNMIF